MNPSEGEVREQDNEQPIRDTPIKSQIPIMITSKRAPSAAAASRTNTKHPLNMNKKH